MPSFFVIRAVERFTYKVAYDLAEILLIYKQTTGECPIYSIMVPPRVGGIVIVEADRMVDVLPFLRELKQARGILRGKLSLQEVYNLTDIEEPTYDPGTQIEIISGPFKGCLARILSDNDGKVTVELEELDYTNRITVIKSGVRKVS